jgi:hypothetical protein
MDLAAKVKGQIEMNKFLSDEWVRTSLRAGYLAARIDDYLGGSEFLRAVRSHGFDITPEFVEEMVRTARSRGVPATELAFDPEFEQALKSEQLVRLGRQWQLETLRRKVLNEV